MSTAPTPTTPDPAYARPDLDELQKQRDQADAARHALQTRINRSGGTDDDRKELHRVVMAVAGLERKILQARNVLPPDPQ
jgi:hypothetical protein